MSPPASSPPWLRVILRALVLVAALGIGSIALTLGVLRFNENALVFATATSHEQPDGALPAYASRLGIADQGGSTLAALLFAADPAHDSGYWVLHLHGNADSAFSRGQIRHCEQLRAAGFSVLAFDYRGFGQSPGDASEEHIYQDARSAYQALIARGVPAGRIILWGHSLGSAPAIELAAHDPAAALVLFGAFTSIPDVAAERYPLLPVRWIAGIHMNSLQRIGRVRMPLIIAHSVHDAVIPFAEGRRLYAAAHEPKQFLALRGATHDGLGGHVDALYDHLPRLLGPLGRLLHTDFWQQPAAPSR